MSLSNLPELSELPSWFVQSCRHITSTYARTLYHIKQQRVYTARHMLFNHISAWLVREADATAIKFEQNPKEECIRIVENLQDNEAGTLYITIESVHPLASGEMITDRHSYSLYLTGDLIRIGLLLNNGLENAPLLDWHNEIQTIWPGCTPAQLDRIGYTMYEWTFLVPDLYSHFETQERYILGMRHMNARVMRIISDYRKMECLPEQ